MIFPSAIGLIGDYCNYGGCGAGAGLTFHLWAYDDCGDLNDAAFMAMYSLGERDGILAKALVPGRRPYDFWNPIGSGAPCSGERLPLCITSYSNAADPCTDTLLNCFCEEISMVPPFNEYQSPAAMAWSSYSNGDISLCIAPDLDFLWSNGETTAHISPPDGWSTCTVNTVNGCWSWTDSVFVINECEWPLVSDNIVVNTNADYPYTITTCSPFWAWSPNIPSGYICQWYQVGQTDTIVNDSIFIAQSGGYIVELIGPAGCRTMNGITVNMPEAGFLDPVDGFSYQLYLPNDSLFDGDTLVTCPEPCVGGYLIAIWTQNGQPITLNEDLYWIASSCGAENGIDPNEPMPWGVPGDVTGWVDLSMEIEINNGPCGSESAVFQFQDSVFVHVVEEPTVTAIVPPYICAGDTLLLVASCTTCDSISWSAGLLTSANGDSAWCTEPGGLVIGAYHTENGVTCYATNYYQVSAPPMPYLGLLPTTICPGDSALLFTSTQGTDIQWTGPLGAFGQDTAALYVHEFGDYYLTMTEPNGCVVSNGPVTLAPFSSPYLLVEPDHVLCPGESVSVEVETSDPGSIVWNAPLSGSDTLQMIDEPGIYSCSVTSCGDTQTLTLYIVGGDPMAEIVDPGPFIGCEGQTFELVGVPGQAVYIWSPHDTLSTSITVDEAGLYQLVVADPFGCFDTSAVVIVELTAADTIALGLDTTICIGASLVLTASGPYSNWIWSTGDTSASTVVAEPGTYTVHGYDPMGCLVIGTAVVDALICPNSTSDATIPNVITPNGDNENDSWGFGPDAPYVQASIFNRWGNEVYRADPRISRWFGKDEQGHELPDGVYFYTLTPSDPDQSPVVKSGYIQLIRP
ncbi:MAG: gliding motility-associated C-terminal domain-containing protein [Flavobacteriales bacterium]|nr:gliding motility-associated C-terminal domain-containing protein [Flavobacteriales bacterium]